VSRKSFLPVFREARLRQGIRKTALVLDGTTERRNAVYEKKEEASGFESKGKGCATLKDERKTR